jgi:hypothetical protein
MKMVEQAAKEYAENLGETLDTDCAHRAFKAGVEFAQEWISVEKELPDAGITVLIKDKNNNYGWACIRYGDWDYKFKNTITHWRPITKK